MHMYMRRSGYVIYAISKTPPSDIDRKLSPSFLIIIIVIVRRVNYGVVKEFENGDVDDSWPEASLLHRGFPS